MQRGSRRLALLAVVLALAGCGPPAGTIFRASLTTPDGSYSMPVTLGDQTGMVVSMEAGRPDMHAGPEAIVSAHPAEPNVLLVSWMGGACEQETIVGFWPDGQRYGMYVATRGGPGLGGGCPAIAISRSIRIILSAPIAVDQIYITTSA
jgi:hypothetical protein